MRWERIASLEELRWVPGGREVPNLLYPLVFKENQLGLCPARVLAIVSAWTGWIIPFSQIIAVMSSAGVTSNAGFQAEASSGAIRRPMGQRTSSGERSSIGIDSPFGRVRSNVLLGAAT